MKYYTSKVGRAIHDWQMIKDGDKIAVGLSGGKDSSLLLYLLAQLRRHAPVDFDLVGLHIDMGWNMDIAPIEEMCRDLGVELIVEKTLIGPIVFHHRKEKNPCSLCANMRRGALCTTARRLGIGKIALAHHMDDAIETLLLNMFHTGTTRCFLPVTFLDRTQVTVIRPLIYLPEKMIAAAAAKLNLPAIPSPCPHSGSSRRQEIKEFIAIAEKKIPRIRRNLLGALQHVKTAELWINPPGRKND
ncbi:MAG TPA: tRNA 2-thiocytidine(32) synthetase TtcA [Firmicutes bacterium]|jgi:tRNA 2-thiocytidine biosynthesis protein TtcA|nr:tRNA 2-thiocytidine(32) synthetase TtcA [Bacillota bacterium]